MRIGAEGFLATERRLIERGDWTAPASRAAVTKAVLTFADYSTTWVAQRSLKPRTRTHYGTMLAEHINPVRTETRVLAVTDGKGRWLRLRATAPTGMQREPAGKTSVYPCEKRLPMPTKKPWPVRRLKLVTLNAANEVVGVDYVRASGYSTDDFRAVIEALFIGDGETLSDYW